MTDTMQALPKDAPVMVAWNAYNGTDDYRNTRNWALHEAHVDGSLWAAFLAGHEACFAIAQKRVNELEADKARLLDAITNRLLEGEFAKEAVPSRKARLAMCSEACRAFNNFTARAALPTTEVPGESEEEMK